MTDLSAKLLLSIGKAYPHAKEPELKGGGVYFTLPTVKGDLTIKDKRYRISELCLGLVEEVQDGLLWSTDSCKWVWKDIEKHLEL